MEYKFDIRIELIKCKFCKKVERTKYAISSSIRKDVKKYHEKGEIEYKRVCVIEKRLLKVIDSLTESETDLLIETMNRHNLNRRVVIESILESDNLPLKQLAGIVNSFPIKIKELPNILWRCYERYYNYKHSGPFWQIRRKEILKQRGNKCEQCGSTEKLHVHHKKGLDDILDKDLELLCQKCHIVKHKPFSQR